jgi:hypothetical protein
MPEPVVPPTIIAALSISEANMATAIIDVLQECNV